jgi:hypothetical protein
MTDSVVSPVRKELASKGSKGISTGITRQWMAQAIDRVMPRRSKALQVTDFIKKGIMIKQIPFASKLHQERCLFSIEWRT